MYKLITTGCDLVDSVIKRYDGVKLNTCLLCLIYAKCLEYEAGKNIKKFDVIAILAAMSVIAIYIYKLSGNRLSSSQKLGATK